MAGGCGRRLQADDSRRDCEPRRRRVRPAAPGSAPCAADDTKAGSVGEGRQPAEHVAEHVIREVAPRGAPLSAVAPFHHHPQFLSPHSSSHPPIPFHLDRAAGRPPAMASPAPLARGSQSAPHGRLLSHGCVPPYPRRLLLTPPPAPNAAAHPRPLLARMSRPPAPRRPRPMAAPSTRPPAPRRAALDLCTHAQGPAASGFGQPSGLTIELVAATMAGSFCALKYMAATGSPRLWRRGAASMDGGREDQTLSPIRRGAGLTPLKGKVKPVHVVDVPGDARLKQKLDEFLPQAARVVFVVDAQDFLSSMQAAAESWNGVRAAVRFDDAIGYTLLLYHARLSEQA